MLWLDLPKLYWIGVVRVGTLVLILILREKVSTFYHCDVAVDLLHMAFIMLRYALSIPNMLRIFIINRCWILSDDFPAYIDMIIWIFSLILLMWSHWLFANLESSLYPRNKSQLILWMILLICSWIWFASISLGIFTSIFIRDMVCSFLVVFFSVLVSA